MCYGSKPVNRPDGKVDWVPNEDFHRLMKEGLILTKPDGYHYAKDIIAAFIWRDRHVEVIPMRWDLIPRDFLKREDPGLAEMIKKKNSRAKNPATGRPVGFTSYNARVETIGELLSFRKPWEEGLRFVTPVVAYKERPNMEGAPAEFTGKEYEVRLDGEYWFGGIYDTWENSRGEKIDSCSVITMDSEGNEKVRGVWHERMPLVLRREQVEEWLDPLTTPRRAREMIKQLSADHMDIAEVPPLPRPVKPEKPVPEDIRLKLDL